MREVAGGARFPDGPIALTDGSVLPVEVRRGTLTRGWPDGRTDVVAELGGGPNGAAIGPDGAVYLCDNGGFEWADVNGHTTPGLEPAGYRGGFLYPDGTLERQVGIPEPDPYLINICFAGAGWNTAWVTSSGSGRLYGTERPYPGLDLAFGA